MIINIALDQSADAAPDGFKLALGSIARILSATFTDPVTINVSIGWGATSGLTLVPGALAQTWVAKTEPYTYREVVDALAAKQDKSPIDIAALASLPVADPTIGGYFNLPRATAKAIGLLASDHVYDGYVAFNNTPGTFTFDRNARAVPGLYDFLAVAENEFSHLMGKTLGLGAPDYTLMDLFRYRSPDERALAEDGPAYFSVDDGRTQLGTFSSQPFTSKADWTTTVGGNDAFRAAFSPGLSYDLSAADIMVMDTLGWTVIASDSFLREDGHIVLAGGNSTAIVLGGALIDEANAKLSDAMLMRGPAHGLVHLQSTGNFDYAPATGFSGIDDFTYRILVDGTRQVLAQAFVHVIPTLPRSPDTLDFLALGAQEQIAAAYAAFFGRAPDAAGFAFWLEQHDRYAPTYGEREVLTGIASSFGVSREATGLYPFLGHAGGAEVSEIGGFLAQVYDNLFNRLPDARGLDYWVGRTQATLAAGQFVGSILLDILSGTKNSPDGLDVTTLAGKVIVSLHYVQQQELHGVQWSGAGDMAAATQLLDPIGSDPRSVLIGMRNADAALTEPGSD